MTMTCRSRFSPILMRKMRTKTICFLIPQSWIGVSGAGKKNDQGQGDNCRCASPHLRKIKIFHRQCHHSGKTKDVNNLYSQQKKPLISCPNCGARNGSGLEPVRRFQESDDETGLAMAIRFRTFKSVPAREKISVRANCFVLLTIANALPLFLHYWKRKHSRMT